MSVSWAEVLFNWEPVRRFLIAVRARTLENKYNCGKPTCVTFRFVGPSPTLWGKSHFPWDHLAQKLWSTQRCWVARIDGRIQLTSPNSSSQHGAWHVRIWSTLPSLSRLRRPIDIKQLKAALARTVWVILKANAWGLTYYSILSTHPRF